MNIINKLVNVIEREQLLPHLSPGLTKIHDRAAIK